MSHALTGLSLGEIAPQSASSILGKRKHEFHELTYPTFRPTFSQQNKEAAQQSLYLFSGAIISMDILVWQLTLKINRLLFCARGKP